MAFIHTSTKYIQRQWDLEFFLVHPSEDCDNWVKTWQNTTLQCNAAVSTVTQPDKWKCRNFTTSSHWHWNYEWPRNPGPDPARPSGYIRLRSSGRRARGPTTSQIIKRVLRKRWQWGDMTWPKLTMTMTMTLREHPQRAILETCDLRLDTCDTDYISDNWEQQY